MWSLVRTLMSVKQQNEHKWQYPAVQVLQEQYMQVQILPRRLCRKLIESELESNKLSPSDGNFSK